jgi:hypothetical protein
MPRDVETNARIDVGGTKMTSPATGTELCRPFLPARDFQLSKRFYEALGFEKLLDSEVAIFRAGRGEFLLQAYYQKDWAENCMLQLMVDDLDAWWLHIHSLDLPGRFGVAAPKAPAMQSWGLRVAYVYDPSGVLWHVGQRRAGVAHD